MKDEDVQQKVKQQKIFVALGAYTQLVQEYNRVCDQVYQDRVHKQPNNLMIARKQALEYVFATLNLPVSM